jgi:hypothetical protein
MSAVATTGRITRAAANPTFRQPVIDPDQWGHPYTNATDPLLSHLSRILSLSNSAHHTPAEEDVLSEESQDDEEYGDLIEEAVQLQEVAATTAEPETPAPPVEHNLWRRASKPEELSATAHLAGVNIGPGMSPIVDDGAELGPPSLVVSVESDAIEFGWTNWREVGLSRADQIVQWTIMASFRFRRRDRATLTLQNKSRL